MTQLEAGERCDHSGQTLTAEVQGAMSCENRGGTSREEMGEGERPEHELKMGQERLEAGGRGGAEGFELGGWAVSQIPCSQARC